MKPLTALDREREAQRLLLDAQAKGMPKQMIDFLARKAMEAARDRNREEDERQGIAGSGSVLVSFPSREATPTDLADMEAYIRARKGGFGARLTREQAERVYLERKTTTVELKTADVKAAARANSESFNEMMKRVYGEPFKQNTTDLAGIWGAIDGGGKKDAYEAMYVASDYIPVPESPKYAGVKLTKTLAPIAPPKAQTKVASVSTKRRIVLDE